MANAREAGLFSAFDFWVGKWRFKLGSWHQAWADNPGGYFDFTGEINGDKKSLKSG
ncbi:MAG: hypothetical protein MI921_15385 [Cytophagales bacterium]|nr:hypothetical protein [Cytophagales bacterium]